MFFVIKTIIVTAAILIYIKKYMPKTKEYRLVKVALTLILAGSMGQRNRQNVQRICGGLF